MKQNASPDASFWINSCAGAMIEHVKDFFQLSTPTVVAAEIRFPISVLGISTYSTTLFDEWVRFGYVTVRDPTEPVDWFHQGENAAIALSVEQNCTLLMDDAHPYHFARSKGLQVVGVANFTVFLFDQGRITYEEAVSAIREIHVSRKQKRDAFHLLRLLSERKGRNS